MEGVDFFWLKRGFKIFIFKVNIKICEKINGIGVSWGVKNFEILRQFFPVLKCKRKNMLKFVFTGMMKSYWMKITPALVEWKSQLKI